MEAMPLMTEKTTIGRATNFSRFMKTVPKGTIQFRAHSCQPWWTASSP